MTRISSGLVPAASDKVTKPRVTAPLRRRVLGVRRAAYVMPVLDLAI